MKKKKSIDKLSSIIEDTITSRKENTWLSSLTHNLADWLKIRTAMVD